MCDEYQTIVHYDGATFETVTRVQDMFLSFDAIAVDKASGQVFAAGQRYRDDGELESIVHWSRNGTDFETVVLGLGGIRDIFIAEENDVYLSGSHGQVYHFDGTTWSKMDTQTDMAFYGIFADAPTDIFAVGPMGVAHFGCDHGSTSKEDYPAPLCEWSDMGGEIMNEMESLWVDSEGMPFVGGTEGIIHMVGDDESQVLWAEGDPRPEGISGTQTALFAVGSASLFLTCDLDTCTPVATPIETDYHSVLALSDSEVYLVGGDESGPGIILRYDGARFTQMPQPLDGPILDIFGTAADNLVAVGVGGILTFDGATWQVAVENSDESIPFRAVSGLSKDDVYVVAGTEYLVEAEWRGAVWHFDGMAWSEVQVDDTATFVSVYVAALDDVFIAGMREREIEGHTEQVIYHFDGGTWKASTGCFESRVKKIHGNHGSVFAMEQEGALYRFTPASADE